MREPAVSNSMIGRDDEPLEAGPARASVPSCFVVWHMLVRYGVHRL